MKAPRFLRALTVSIHRPRRAGDVSVLCVRHPVRSTEPTPHQVTHTSAHHQHLHHSSPHTADDSVITAGIRSNAFMTMPCPALHKRHCHCFRSTPQAMRRQRRSRCAEWARRRRRSAAAERTTIILQATASAASVHWRSTTQPRRPPGCLSSLPRQEPVHRFGDLRFII